MPPKLVHFTLASDHIDDAVAFYRAVLSANFDPIEVGGETLYRGEIAGLMAVICPAAMAGVVANRSRHQLRFEVDDVAGLVARAVEHRGRVHTPVERSNGRSYAVICDPDNNTIELTESSGEEK